MDPGKYYKWYIGYLCSWYGSEDFASNTVILSNCHLLELVSIPSRYPFENDGPIDHTQQSSEE
jgi:hypothetical protein